MFYYTAVKIKLISINFILILFVSFILNNPAIINAQQSIVIEKIPGGNKAVTIRIAEQGYPSEMTPKVTLQPNGKYLYTLSSGFSFVCESDLNILEGDVILHKVLPDTQKVGCKLISKSEHIKDILYDGGALIFQDSDLFARPEWNDWRRTYDGVVDLELVKMNDGTTRIYALNHGEQANAKPSYQSTSLFQNAVYNVPINKAYTDINGKYWQDGCWSSVDNQGTYTHCWDAFTSFANLQWNNYNPQIGFESIPGDPVDYGGWAYEGPVIWLSRGYKDSNGSRIYSESFPYLTSLFVQDPLDSTNTNRYMYSFYRDGKCLRVSRASLSSGGRSGNWYNYLNGSFATKSLPNGFSKERIRDFYSSKGGGYDCIKIENNVSSLAIPAQIINYYLMYFEVAKTQKGDYVATVENQLWANDGNVYWAFGITVSPDLIHWSPIEYFHKVKGEWGTAGGNYGYPVFLNDKGTSNKEINTDNFYVLGTGAVNDGTTDDYTKNLLQLNLKCVKPSKISGFKVNTDTILNGNTLQMVYKQKVSVEWNKPNGVLDFAVRYNDKTTTIIDRYKENTLIYTPISDTVVDFWIHSIGYCSHWSDWSTADHYYIKFGKRGDFNLDGKADTIDLNLASRELFKGSKEVYVVDTFDINANGNFELVDLIHAL